MTLYEDASGHILKRHRGRDHLTGNKPHTWCTRCGAMVEIHEVTNGSAYHMGKKDCGRKPRAERLKPRNALTDYHMVVRGETRPEKGRPVDGR